MMCSPQRPVQVVQQRPDSYPCSVSGQVSGKHTTPLQLAGPFALAPMPPVRSLVHERSSGALISSLQQIAQQVPASAAGLISNGGIHCTLGHSVPAQGSFTLSVSKAKDGAASTAKEK